MTLWRVASNEVARIAPHGMVATSVYFSNGKSNGKFYKGRDHIIGTPTPSESYPISLSHRVDCGVVGHVDKHTYTQRGNISQAARAT